MKNTIGPKYSFVMPAYKGQFFRQSIESILNQTYKDWELIIVDDASPDNLYEIFSEYDDIRIRFYRNEYNIGGVNLVSQWNHCVEYARGKWVILATDDDVYTEDFLMQIEVLSSKYPSVNIIRGRVATCDANGNVINPEACMPEELTREEMLYYMFNGLHGGIPQYAFKKNALASIGGFYNYPMAWASDDYTALLLSAGNVVFSSKILLKFRMSNSNISACRNHVEEKLVARFLYYSNIYENIIPLLDEKSIFTRIIKLNYLSWVWKDLLMYFHLIPLFRRYKFFKMVKDKTPYLNCKQKFKLCLRAYVKKIKVSYL
jgi:glycosyltransferase involved in cell wall biosynthesis